MKKPLMIFLACFCSMTEAVFGQPSDRQGTNAQMLIPGFEIRELPVRLKNINNLRYRHDGKLLAVGYNGKLFLLSDTDGDGFEDRVENYWDQEGLRVPLGVAFTPPGYAKGDGVFVACVGKVVLLTDTNNDGLPDKETIVATGWPDVDNRVDALGMAVGPDGSIYFGLGIGTAYANAYRIDKASGLARIDLKSERGTILRVTPDFSSREIFATGIRFPVALVFNKHGDLFCSEQEGATWLPNGNPFDELLHVQQGRHYGFPPRHPKHLPGVIDEPSTFDYGPQHQSTCGMVFNEAGKNGIVFGPAWWDGDLLMTGESRGKLWRTKLVKTGAGYVAQNQLIASTAGLTVDVAISPRGDLVLANHGGKPDWGNGPNGDGQLLKIRYADSKIPQAVLFQSSGPAEFKIHFDKPLSLQQVSGAKDKARLMGGQHVAAGDRFESFRPGYQVVKVQQESPRKEIKIHSINISADRRTLALNTDPASAALHYGLELNTPPALALDLATDLGGCVVKWTDGKESWAGSLPHPEFLVSRELTRASADHAGLWRLLTRKGRLTVRGQFDLLNMLNPPVQPGSKLDWDPPAEVVTVRLSAALPFGFTLGEVRRESVLSGNRHVAAITWTGTTNPLVAYEISINTGNADPDLQVGWFTGEDSRLRPFPLRKTLLPWASATGQGPWVGTKSSELTGGDGPSGRKLFFGEKSSCSKCHEVENSEDKVGPSLANLAHRDYDSVLKDIREPSGAINPDYLAYEVELKQGEPLLGLIRNQTEDYLIVVDAAGKPARIEKRNILSIKPSSNSLMPAGLLDSLSPQEIRDLMTFLLSPKEN